MAGQRLQAESLRAKQQAAAFRAGVCLPHLVSAQNADGGWGFRAWSASAVEATCWALLAMEQEPEASDSHACREQGIRWLLKCQLADGSWPVYPDQVNGCWATSLACLALKRHPNSHGAVVAGARWLLNAWPAEGNFWRRVQRWISRADGRVRLNPLLRGWAWTPGTSSWVEPTACTLIALQNIPVANPRQLQRRARLAEAMLFDRCCPQGGWNSGNPFVYGVPGEPLVGPTVWTLLALQAQNHRTEVQKSLAWLEDQLPKIKGPGSLALAHICLRVFGWAAPPVESRLRKLFETNGFLGNIPVLAYCAISLQGSSEWLGMEKIPERSA